jgi:hypothetical protein
MAANATMAIHTPAPTVSESFMLVEGRVRSTIVQHATAIPAAPAQPPHLPPIEGNSSQNSTVAATSSVAIHTTIPSATQAMDSIPQVVSNPNPTTPASPIPKQPEAAEETKVGENLELEEEPKQEASQQEEVPESDPLPAVENNEPPTEVVEYPAGFLISKRTQ